LLKSIAYVHRSMRSHKAGLVGFAYGVLWGMHSTGALWKRTPQAGWLVRAQQGKQRGEKPRWARHLVTLKHHDALARS